MLSEEIFMIFDYGIYNRRYVEGIAMDPKIVNFYYLFEITKFAKLKDVQ